MNRRSINGYEERFSREFASQERKERYSISEETYREAQEILDRDRMRPEEFTDLYGSETIDRDREYVERTEKKFENDYTPEDREALRMATVLEAMVNEQIELGDWFGPDANTTVASKFDDYKNGVDTIVEFIENDANAKHLGLAIDATFSTAKIIHKIERIKDEIDMDLLTKIKYFRSDHLDIRGELSGVPRVIIGVDKQTIMDMVSLWKQKKKRELNEHPAQLIILQEIVAQLEAFRDYARATGKENIAQKMEARLKIIQPVLETKMSDSRWESSTQSFSSDKVYTSIKKEAERFKRTAQND